MALKLALVRVHEHSEQTDVLHTVDLRAALRSGLTASGAGRRVLRKRRFGAHAASEAERVLDELERALKKTALEQ